MLAQVSRTARCAVIRQTSLRAPVGPSPPHGWLSFLTYPTNCARQPVGSLARVYASDTQWNRALRRQIISSANKIQFRYDVDSHKSLTDAIVDEAEKAIG